MTAQLANERRTFADFLSAVPDGVKAELFDGNIVRPPSDTRCENQLIGFLSTLVGLFLSARGQPGELFMQRFTARLDDWNAVEPDLMFVQSADLNRITELYLDGPPTVAVEIVSCDSRQRDWVDKRHKYESAGVEEYWIIDPVQRRVEFLRLQGSRYDIVPLEENRFFRSRAIRGFWLNIEWLLASPLPNEYHCLQELLADG